MNDDLRAKLAHDLKHSGFYSEMLAIRTCVARDWECHGSFTYFDKDEKASRECDFEAVKRHTEISEDSSAVDVVVRLLGQVKKSERPWIVFKDESERVTEEDGWSNLVHLSGGPVNREMLAQRLHAGSLLATTPWKASGVHEAFKKPSDSSTWYAAFVTACKAAESAYDTAVATSRSENRIGLDFIKPIVVVDGLIVSAELDEDTELVLAEVESAPFQFEYRSDAYHRSHYYLDLVTLKGFSAYLDATEERIRIIAEALR